MAIREHTMQAGDFEQPRWANYLFNSRESAWIWLVLRLWVGWAWVEAAIEKLNQPGQWIFSGAGIHAFWARAVTIPQAPARPAITYDWYRQFLQLLLNSGADSWFGPLITFAELLVGVGLILGAMVGFAAFFGAFMNINFMLAGAASTNPVLFLVAMLLVLAWKVAGYYGLDRWILPALGTPWHTGWLTGNGKQRAVVAQPHPA